MNYTVKELIEKLKDFKPNMKVEIDCDAGIFEEMDIEQASEGRVVIFTKGDSKW